MKITTKAQELADTILASQEVYRLRERIAELEGSHPIPKDGDLFLHDQKNDTADCRYSIQSEAGGVLFLFNECGITAREVFEIFKAGREAIFAKRAALSQQQGGK